MRTTPSTPARQAATGKLGRRAIVMGASMAGLLAARVLSECFDEVWLLERDELPQGARQRKGTPHAVHSHGLLAGGLAMLEELFPKLTDSLVAAGAVGGDFGRDGIFHAGTRRFAQAASSLHVLGVSRLTLEAHVRQRVLALPNVKAHSHIDVTSMALSEDQGTVTGVHLARRDAQGQAISQETWSADFVIDTTGRTSRTPRWLATHGYPEPPEERVGEGVPMNYVTVSMERRADEPADVLMAICGSAIDVPKGFVMIAQEPDAQGRGRWSFTFGGYGDDRPPMDIEGLRERSRANHCPEATRVLSADRLLGEPIRYQFAYSLRRHYEKLARFPARLLVMGDAMASFNPIYGQGMTVASAEAMLLREMLATGLDSQLHRRYFERAAALVDVPWETAVASDLQHEMIPGQRTMNIRMRNLFWRHAVVAAQHDPKVALGLLKVGHFMAHPDSMMRPGMLARILWSRLKGDPRRDEAPDADADTSDHAAIPRMPAKKVQNA